MTMKCSQCQIEKPKSQFAKSQLQKSPEKRRCRACTSSSSYTSVPATASGTVTVTDTGTGTDTDTPAVVVTTTTTTSTATDALIIPDDSNDTDNHKEDTISDNTNAFTNEKENKEIKDIKEKEEVVTKTKVQLSQSQNNNNNNNNTKNGDNNTSFILPDEFENSFPRALSNMSDLTAFSPVRNHTDNTNNSTIHTTTTLTTATLNNTESTTTTTNISMPTTIPSIVVQEPLNDNRCTATSKVRVGICAMDKKAKSKPMNEILSRLDKEIFEIVPFGDKVILNSPVNEWPICDVLIAFYSNGYPLDKAEEYVTLHPDIFVLNDLKMQRVLMDRRRVYDLLEASGIDVPRHVFMNRDGYVSTSDILSSPTNNFMTNDAASIISNHASSVICSLDHSTTTVLDNNSCENMVEECELIEHDDHIEVNGVVIHKPFVEKPVDADDHNIAIYYPYSAGGGCKKLFRKIGDRSSEFYPHINEVRRDGSYIYEEYVETQGIDVKMYTVGPDYGHAEARKSPTVDGKVERNSDGKEVRFPVILTLREKEIARRIVMVFKQQVCGFDLLRVQEGDSLVSYVCDVNGWSFVKKSKKYYDDCAQILTEHMLAARKPRLLHGFSALNPLLTKVKDFIDTPTRKKKIKALSPTSIHNKNSNEAYMLSEGASHVRTLPDMMVVEDPTASSVISTHGDDETTNSKSTVNSNEAYMLSEGASLVRTLPDMMMVGDPAALSVISTNDDEETTNSKSTVKSTNNTNSKQTVPSTHHEELRCVITVIRHGDRTPKQKLKVKISEPVILKYFHDHADNYKKELKVKDKVPMTEFLDTINNLLTEKEKEANYNENRMKKDNIIYKLLHMRDILERWKIGGLNRKLQMKPTKWDESTTLDGVKVLTCTQLQLILKWGGNLTKLGEKQSINLGKRLRHEIYPDEAGGGILRLHSTFRHDLKIKTSDEGRVMKTAAAFAKGLLELEGEIPPILVSLVHKEKNSHHMLDPSGNKEVKKELDSCKSKITKQLQQDIDIKKAKREVLESMVGPSRLNSLHKALKLVGNPRKTLFAIRDAIGELLEQLEDMLGVITSDMENKIEGGEGLQCDVDEDETLSGIKLYKGETLLELTERWRQLYTKLYDEDEDKFDLSRVPDVHDNVRFDMLHNPHIGLTKTLDKLYKLAKLMADCVVPQEYGITIREKRDIGNKMCGPLLEKLLYDLIIARTDNQVDMRYMINMHYAADLPINSMGRRIRTRLYFTSESHLHTLLNVLRFASTDTTSKAINPLSAKGISIISNASELCYLTQIVIRLFENTSKDIEDPKRYRIEIFFSPGATATPMHISELERDADSSRFDTEPLQLISKPCLTCKELEDYFTESIREGRIEEKNDDDNIMPSIMNQNDISSTSETQKKKVKDEAIVASPRAEEDDKPPPRSEETPVVTTSERIKFVTISEENNIHIPFLSEDSCHSTLGEGHPLESTAIENLEKKGTEGTIISEQKELPMTALDTITNTNLDYQNSEKSSIVADTDGSNHNHEGKNDGEDKDHGKDEDERVKEMAIILARQYFWTSVAALSFVLGIGCLILSREVQSDFKTRRWTRR